MTTEPVTHIIDEPAGKSAGRTVSFHTLGCKLNRSESDALATRFAERGYRVVPFREPADLTVINTCTVTGEADAKSRQTIRQAVAASPRGKVAAVGCFTQLHPHQAGALEGVDLVLGSQNKFHIFDFLEELDRGDNTQPLIMVDGGDEVALDDADPFIAATSRTRAVLKVQDGCDYTCSYCIIPAARGQGRSRRLAACIHEARELVDRGYSEIVLTGVNIGTWTDDILGFDDLLEAISDVEGLLRIRVSSIEPNLVTDRMLRLVAERDNICPHLHIPMQHASDRILGAMRRRYQFSAYRAVVERAHRWVPDIAIGADVIVGFPGESEDDFTQLATAVAELPLAYHHIFRYSEREGTLATALADSVDAATRRKRSALLHAISRRTRKRFARRQLQQTRPVHFEHRDSEGYWSGLTDNYLRVHVSTSRPVDGRIHAVILDREENGYLYGTLAA